MLQERKAALSDVKEQYRVDNAINLLQMEASVEKILEQTTALTFK